MSTDLLSRLIASHYMAPDDGDQANRAKRNAARTGRVGGAEAAASAETAGAAPAAARLRTAAAAQRDRLEAPSIFRFRCQARQGRGRLRGKTDGVAESEQWKRRRPRGFRRGRVGFWEVGGRGKREEEGPRINGVRLAGQEEERGQVADLVGPLAGGV